ncbi:MAG TPA: cyclic nucleotide-binding domain-containing protein [Gaiellaceae bacterium]|jgi:CRP-like cAMP-binding protein|nr:cyclic nucleotide-binding domain-containing protein [Gaiellaceae bacterium]
MPPPVSLLKRVQLFENLSDKQLRALSAEFKERPFTEGEELVAEGAHGIGLFVVSLGELRVSIQGKERRSLGPGDYFGEIALIDDGMRTATVTAATDGLAYGLTKWQFKPLIESSTEIAWPLLEAMARRTRELEAREDG